MRGQILKQLVYINLGIYNIYIVCTHAYIHGVYATRHVIYYTYAHNALCYMHAYKFL